MLERVGGSPIEGRLVYRRSEQQVDTEPPTDEGFASLLVNDVQIELTDAGLLRHVWGYCPDSSWTRQSLDAPKAEVGCLAFRGNLVPGVSRRLNAERWPVGRDESTGWICIGDCTANFEAVAFAPGAIAMLASGEIVALWLKPEIVQ